MSTTYNKDYFTIDDKQLARIQRLEADYKRLIERPDDCRPMFQLVDCSRPRPTWEEVLASPEAMLMESLDAIRPHLAMADDALPIIRAEFGTAIYPSAYGCEIRVPTNSLPACYSHALQNAEDVIGLPVPAQVAGLFAEVERFSKFYMENLPEGVNIQHMDIQSAFNSAYLIRGNDILTDFYDCPELVEALLDHVTDYMIAQQPWISSMTSNHDGWFYDSDALWKGEARISNCSLHIISPAFYTDHVMARDQRFFQSIGGGRVHYCGTEDKVIDHLFKLEDVNGLDYDPELHDLWEMCERAPKHFPLMQAVGKSEKSLAILDRLLRGDWPEKRNLIFTIYVANADEGRALMHNLRRSIPE